MAGQISHNKTGIRERAAGLWSALPGRERRNWIRLGWLTLVLVAVSAALIDLPLARAMERKNESIHLFLASITDFGKSTFWLISTALAALALWYLGENNPARTMRRLYRWLTGYMLFAFAAIAISGLAVNLVKLIIGRARPRMYFRDDFYGISPPGLASDFQSFPSGHASTVIALAAALALFLPRWRTPIICAGLFMALTRVAVNAHYLGDVIGGAFLTFFTVSLIGWYCAGKGWLFEAGPSGTLRCRTEGRYLAGLIGRKLHRR